MPYSCPTQRPRIEKECKLGDSIKYNIFVFLSSLALLNTNFIFTAFDLHYA